MNRDDFIELEKQKSDMAAWSDRMNKCNSQSEMEYLLKTKPKGIKSAIMTGSPIVCGGGSVSPLLNKLMSGKK